MGLILEFKAFRGPLNMLKFTSFRVHFSFLRHLGVKFFYTDYAIEGLFLRCCDEYAYHFVMGVTPRDLTKIKKNQ